MHGTAFKEIELDDGSGECFEGSAEFCWTATLYPADRETGEAGGWETSAHIKHALIDDTLFTRDELIVRFSKAEVTRMEAYYEEEAFPEELNDWEAIYDDDDAKFEVPEPDRALGLDVFALAAE